jgi:hypothetical protein
MRLQYLSDYSLKETNISLVKFPVVDVKDQWYTQEFFSGGGSTNLVEDTTERMGIWGQQSPI